MILQLSCFYVFSCVCVGSFFPVYIPPDSDERSRSSKSEKDKVTSYDGLSSAGDVSTCTGLGRTLSDKSFISRHLQPLSAAASISKISISSLSLTDASSPSVRGRRRVGALSQSLSSLLPPQDSRRPQVRVLSARDLDAMRRQHGNRQSQSPSNDGTGSPSLRSPSTMREFSVHPKLSLSLRSISKRTAPNDATGVDHHAFQPTAEHNNAVSVLARPLVGKHDLMRAGSFGSKCEPLRTRLDVDAVRVKQAGWQSLTLARSGTGPLSLRSISTSGDLSVHPKLSRPLRSVSERK